MTLKEKEEARGGGGTGREAEERVNKQCHSTRTVGYRVSQMNDVGLL